MCGGRGFDMAVIARRADNPSVLGLGVHRVVDLDGRWWVGHTRSRCEKASAWEFEERGIGYFLPMIWKTHISSGKRRRSLLPLFPSYIFFCGDETVRQMALGTNRLCQVIPVAEQDRFVSELAGIEQALASRTPVELYRHAAVGRRCRIASGSLKGLEGVVVSRGRRARLVLEVSMLGQGALVEIEADLLEPAE